MAEPYQNGVGALPCRGSTASRDLRNRRAVRSAVRVDLRRRGPARRGSLAAIILIFRLARGRSRPSCWLPALARRCGVPAAALWIALAGPLVGAHLIGGRTTTP